MRKVYEDQDMTMVGYYRSVLEEEGIATSVKNEYAQQAAGEVPFQQVYPELWVMEDEDYAKAVELIRSLREQEVDEDHSPVNYKRSGGLQVVMWSGTLIVVGLLMWTLCSVIQLLLGLGG